MYRAQNEACKAGDGIKTTGVTSIFSVSVIRYSFLN